MKGQLFKRKQRLPRMQLRPIRSFVEFSRLH